MRCSPLTRHGELIAGKPRGDDMGRAEVSRREAFTLLEMVVALAIAGLALAIVAPSLVLRRHSADVAIQDVVSSARRTAARRAESLTLELGSSGEWVLESSTAGHAVASGRIDGLAGHAFRVRVSPLGSCLPEQYTTSDARPPLDPLDCTWKKKAGTPP